MPFIAESERKIAFKKLLGRAHTDNDKQPGNEARFSFVQGSASALFGEPLNAAPSNATLGDITDANVEFVRLVLTPDPSANGHAFVASLPGDYEATSSNPKAGTGVFTNGSVLSESSGALQIVPPLYGLNYEAKPYRGGSASQGSGDLVPPGDAVDWNLDYANGVVFQEDDPGLSPPDMTYIECFIYIGKTIQDSLGDVAASSPISETGNVDVDTGQELLAQVAASDARALKWIVEAHDLAESKSYTAEVIATRLGSNVEHQVYGVVTIGNPAFTFCQLDVDVDSGNTRLLATVDEDNVIANVTQLVVR